MAGQQKIHVLPIFVKKAQYTIIIWMHDLVDMVAVTFFAGAMK